MYVDESGDPGMLPGSPTRYHVLAGLIVHESQWQNLLDDLLRFRQQLQHTHGFSVRAEIHAAEFLQPHRANSRMPRHIRLDILKKTIDFCARRTCIRIVGFVLDKRVNDTEVFRRSWSALIQQFERMLEAGSLPCTVSTRDCGMLVCDNTDVTKLKSLLRQHRAIAGAIEDPANSGTRLTVGVRNIVEDPVARDSAESYFVQTVDVIAYFLHQLQQPNEFVRRKHASGFYNRLKGVLVMDEKSGDPFVRV